MRENKLHNWINTYLRGASINRKLRSDLYVNLKIAGFVNGVPSQKESLARRIASCTIREDRKVQASATRVAAVVSADSNCPRCGGTMTTVRLAGSEQARYCQNPQCRVTCHIGG